jgi:serine/threonine protein kinase
MYENSQLACPLCKTLNPASSKLCLKCGNSIISESETFIDPLELEETYPEIQSPFIKVKEGMIINDRFKIKKKIGTGGFGTVYFAHDKILDENVALKILHPQFNIDSEVKERFLREIKLARKISHTNVVRIFDISEVQGNSIISMEYFESKNLKEVIQKEGVFKFDRALKIIKQICQALDSAHEINIIHRDIKPHNILVNDEDLIKIVDFGIARNIYRNPDEGVTKTGTIIGTPDYMSPEQASGNNYDHRSDLYSLGIVIYEMLSGAVPFKSESPLNTLLQHIQERHESIVLRNHNVPYWFSEILDKILEKKPQDRYNSGKEIVDDIDRGFKKEELKANSMSKANQLLNQRQYEKALNFAKQAKEIDPNDEEIQKLILKISKKKREDDLGIKYPDQNLQRDYKLKEKYRIIQLILMIILSAFIVLFLTITTYKYFQLSSQKIAKSQDLKILLLNKADNLYDRCLTKGARENYFSILRIDPLCTPLMINTLVTYVMDFTLSNFMFSRITFICTFFILVIGIIKVVLNPERIGLYFLPIFVLVINILFVIVFYKIDSSLEAGRFKLDSEKNLNKPQLVPDIHYDIAKKALKDERYLDAIVEFENFLFIKPLSIMGYFYYYTTYISDILYKGDIGIPIFAIFKFLALSAFFVSFSILILKL